jgi:hypothetical protein
MVVILNEECAFRYTFESKLKRTKVVQKGPCGFKDFFIRPSVRRDVLWYTNVRLSVRLSVRPFHMSRSNLRTPWSIHFKLQRVIGIDGFSIYSATYEKSPTI